MHTNPADTVCSISVIMPCWNTAAWLQETMESLLQQHLSDYEILCMDDGSTDETGAMLDAYAAAFPKIRVIHNENHGQGWERNQAISLAKGKYIYYMDSDDALAPGSLRTLYELAETQNLDLILFEAEAFYESEALRERFPAFQTLYRRKKAWPGIWEGKDLYTRFRFEERWNVSPCLQLVRKELLMQEGIRFAETSMYEDNIYYAQVMQAAKKVMCIQDPFYHRRVREASTMTANPNPTKKLLAIKAVVDSLLSLAKDAEGKYQTAVLSHLGRFYMQPAIQDFIKENPELAKQLYASLDSDMLFHFFTIQTTVITDAYKQQSQSHTSSDKSKSASKVEALQEKLDIANAKIADLKKKQETHKATAEKLKKVETDCADIKAKLEHTREQLVDTKQKLSETKNQLQEIKTESLSLREKNKTLQSQLEKARESIATLKEECHATKVALAVAKNEVERARSETEHMRVALEAERDASIIKKIFG